MIDYSQWSKKKLSITKLRLDIDNPRLSDSTRKLSQNQIIDYLINKEKVVELAENILNNGYFLNESPIVVKENNKYHVLEGNRRVAALKIIINPDLISSTTQRRKIKTLVKSTTLALDKIEVIISPNREDADTIIINRHTNGMSVERWDKTKQDRFLYKRYIAGESIDEIASKFPISKGDIKAALKRYNVYRELCKLELDDNIKDSVLDETDFKMSTIERFFNDKEGIAFMGFEFDDNFNVIQKLPSEEFNKRLEKVVTDYVKGELNTRTLNSQEDRSQYVKKLWSTNSFDQTIIPDKKYNLIKDEPDDLEIDKNEPTIIVPKVPRKRKTAKVLIPDNIFFETGIGRLDDIFDELKTLSLEKHPNAVAVLLRSYLDMLAYQFLKKKNGHSNIKQEIIQEKVNENAKKLKKIKAGLEKLGISVVELTDRQIKESCGLDDRPGRNSLVPSLKHMLSHIADSDEYLEDEKLKQALQAYLKNTTKLLGHNDFNLLVHNEYYTADADELQKAWAQLYPMLDFFIKTVRP